MGFLGLILPALLPPVADGISILFKKFFGGAGKPLTVDDQIKLDASNVEKLKVLAQLDTPGGTPSQWVVDLRASFRYIAAGVIMLLSYIGLFAFMYMLGAGTVSANIAFVANLVQTLLEMSGSVFSFIFGDRVYFNLKNWLVENKKG